MNELISSDSTPSTALLLRQIADLRAENASLKARIEALVEEIRNLRGGKGSGTPLWVKPSRPPKEKPPRRKRPQGFARRRELAEVVVEHAREVCPDCGHQLSGGWRHRVRQVIAVVLPRVQVTEQVFQRRYCGVSPKEGQPEVTPQALGGQGKRRLGASVQALVALLHLAGRTPIRFVRQPLQELWGLQRSNGEILALLEGGKQAGAPARARLREQVRSAPCVCADETGWREDGVNGYRWTFSTPTARYFE